ncbi:hypothetical protein K469DRAFT_555931 [Zopfia rhizophila CBS 207.26]|uniref:Uncharacterized protein n=1 Tax=Zopfia rhizophila CBS 207.26 TaxID=1314779 RepID=A0A6A6EMT4_9PEZI|nr:hypothetical protein K469DRAFT_555931 [Zopfia rhizophila CBS 207.26]
MASMADVQYSNIYKGPWIDWSKGAFRGANITVTSTNGAVVVAFLALFVQYAGQHLWGIICFTWHQWRITNRSKRALEHQQDITLRNNASPGQTSWYFVQIAWSWRSSAQGWWFVAALPISIPATCMGLIFAAGILSSSIVDTIGVDVLVRGNNCGVWAAPDQDTFDGASEYMIENNKYMRNLAEFSKQYGRTCYNKIREEQSLQCKAFAKSSILYSTFTNASCPFDRSTCFFEDDRNLMMDTGRLDTNKVFGINTPTHNLGFRKVTTCAPIKPKLFTTTSPDDKTGIIKTNGSTPHNFTQWHFGTYVTGHDFILQADAYQAETTRDYRIQTEFFFHMDPRVPIVDQTRFLPRAEFNVSDGDLKIMFMMTNAMRFSEPCNDPWFSAHRAYVDPLVHNKTLYLSDNLASPMGCVEQYQFCNPKNDACTQLAPILPAIGSAKSDLSLTPLQAATVDVLFNAIYMLNTDISIPSFHGSSFLAQQSIIQTLQLPLPDNQWQLELQDMHNTVLSMLQRDIVDYARGPGSMAAQKFITMPKEGPARELCTLIRARADGRFSNINTYGLALTLILGGLIILTNLFVVDILAIIYNKRGRYPSRHNAWVTDGILQLQRRVFELQYQGIWKGEKDAVPTTVHGDLIARKSELPGARGPFRLSTGNSSRTFTGYSLAENDAEKAGRLAWSERDMCSLPGLMSPSVAATRQSIEEDDMVIRALANAPTLTEEMWEKALPKLPKD